MSRAERLQKVIAAAGHCSRRKAEELIAAGRVTVDGRTAALGEKAEPAATILIDGRPLGRAESHDYVLLHKPVGVVCTLHDPQGRQRVTDLVKEVGGRLYPVGRLDLTTSGLLILTNDGDLAQHLAHPRHQVDKTYLVRVRGRLDRQALRQLEQGVVLDDGPTAPARIAGLRHSASHSWFELTLHEGRNRQVRRMCEAIGYPVSRLARIGYAFLTLDGLAPGAYRRLTASEVARLKAL
ncbi:MAG: pseudouridine synthase [Desulfuromonadales bacterium]|nr:pseudouridine synthase [Desulfuromonadales bacterium]